MLLASAGSEESQGRHTFGLIVVVYVVVYLCVYVLFVLFCGCGCFVLEVGHHEGESGGRLRI